MYTATCKRKKTNMRNHALCTLHKLLVILLFYVFTVEYFSFVFLFATLIYYTQTENYFEPKK